MTDEDKIIGKIASLDECKKRLKDLAIDFELVAHIASHDLRDPLRQVLLNFDKIKEQKDINNLKLIDECEYLINDVLEKIGKLREYSYIVNKPSKVSEVDLNECYKTAIEKLKDFIDKRNAIINCNEPLPKVIAHEGQMIKVICCLIENAIKFNESETPILNILVERNNNAWEFCFQDNGIGLDKIYKDFVFALFQRLDPESQDTGYGTGLAFVKKIITNHGGIVWFDSEEGRGASFYFSLPVNS